jgi:hypothetical protein
MTGTATSSSPASVSPAAAYGVHSEVGVLRKVTVCAPGLAQTAGLRHAERGEDPRQPRREQQRSGHQGESQRARDRVAQQEQAEYGEDDTADGE